MSYLSFISILSLKQKLKIPFMRFLLTVAISLLYLTTSYGQEWSTLNAEGFQYYQNGKYVEARESFIKALEIAKTKSGEASEPYIHSLNNLAFVYKGSGNYNEARKTFQLVTRLLEKIHSSLHVDQIEALVNLGNVYLETGQYDSCEIYFQHALQKMSTALKNLDEDYKRQREQYELTMVNLQNGFASMYKKKGQLKEAIETLDIQREYLKKHDTSTPALKQAYKTILVNLSSYHLENGKPEEAKGVIKEYIRLQDSVGEQPSTYLYALKTLGDINRNEEKIDSAMLAWNEALKIIDRGAFQGSILHLSLLNNLGELYAAIEDYPNALTKLTQARKLNETRGGINPNLYQTTLYNLAEAYQWSGDYAAADQVYQVLMKHLLQEVQHNFTYLSESEKISFYRSQLVILESYISFALTISGSIPLQKSEHPYINKTVTQQLYDLQIMTKGIILNSSHKMKNRIMNGNDSNLKNSYRLWEAKKSQLANVLRTENPDPDQLRKLEQFIDYLEQKLSRASASYNKGFLIQNVSWRDIQKKLNPGEVAVEMIRFVNGLLYGALIITPETKEQPFLAIVESTRTRHLEKEYYRQYANAIEHQFTDTVSYAVYWKPILDAIRAAMPTGQKLSRIYFSPDGIYNQINVNTLYSHDKHYVIDQTELFQVTSTKEILKDEISGKRPKTAALFGRPSYASPDFADLPGTEKEVDQITKYLDINHYHSRVYKHANATESNLKNVDSPFILHIATHGFFDNSAESSSSLVRILLNSGIVLSESPALHGSQAEDGILTSYEALNLNLDANELTVLSACETGLGEFYPGEGVYGLRLALTSAGAKYVIMSLWKVDDQATQELMILFYEHWLKKPGNIRLAFQTAQRELRKKYSQPYYWGAFVLTGK